jgi:hypothetical protein
MKRDFSKSKLVLLSLSVGVYAAACAADAGDPLKTIGSAITGPDGSIVGDDASDTTDATTVANDSPGTVVPPDDSGPVVEDSGGTPEAAPIVDAGPPPDVGVGAGCASGATVIVLMPGAGQYTANTGNFNTLAAVCVELMGSVHQGWNISNGQGRMLTVTSAAGTSAAIDSGNSTAIASLSQTPQAGSDGFVYWNFTAETGIVNYTSVYIF